MRQMIAGLIAGVAFAALLGAHMIERFGFFTAVTAPRMPGGV